MLISNIGITDNGIKIETAAILTHVHNLLFLQNFKVNNK